MTASSSSLPFKTNRPRSSPTAATSNTTKRYSYTDGKYIYDIIEEEILVDNEKEEEQQQEEIIVEEELVTTDDESDYTEEEIVEDTNNITPTQVRKKVVQTEEAFDYITENSTEEEEEESRASSSFPFDEVLAERTIEKEGIVITDFATDNQQLRAEPGEEEKLERVGIIMKEEDLYWAMQGAMDAYLEADLNELYARPPWSKDPVSDKEKATYDNWKSWKQKLSALEEKTEANDKSKGPKEATTKEVRKETKATVITSAVPTAEPTEPTNQTRKSAIKDSQESDHLKTKNVLVENASKENNPENDRIQHWMKQGATQIKVVPDKKSSNHPKKIRSYPVSNGATTRSTSLQGQEGTVARPRDIESQQPLQIRNPLLDKFFDEPVDLVNPLRRQEEGSARRERDHDIVCSEDKHECDPDRTIVGAIVLGLILVLPFIAMGVVLIVRSEQGKFNDSSDDVQVIPMIPPVNSTTENNNNIFSNIANTTSSSSGEQGHIDFDSSMEAYP